MNKKISSKRGEELRMIKLIKEIEGRIGKLVPLEEIYQKGLTVFFSGNTIKEIIGRLVKKNLVYIPREGYLMFVKKPLITKDSIEADYIYCKLSHKGVDEPSGIFCDKIECLHNISKNNKLFGFVFDHHLMFWKRGDLVFKVWLPNNEDDKEFKDIFEAMKSVGIKCNLENK